MRDAIGASDPIRRAGLLAFRATYRAPRPLVPVRDELPVYLNQRGLLGCAAEVGVQEGHFSTVLLQHWRGRHLVSIDPWSASQASYLDIANVEQRTHDAFYDEARRRLAPFGTRSTIWRTTGTEAATRVLHHSLDFVYLDARHDYESVRSDLDDWFDKVRPGGVIAGHDYVDGEYAEGAFGVRSAVDEFFGDRGLPVHATCIDPPWVSWWVALPAR